MKITILAFLSALFGSSTFTTDPNAGMVAAREMGLPNYVEFQHAGKTDSAALFYWRGNWWVYHPSFGSMKTVLDDPKTVPLAATLAIDGATGPLVWKKVSATPLTAELGRGCLPLAVADVRKHGGGIAVTQNHARAVR